MDNGYNKTNLIFNAKLTGIQNDLMDMFDYLTEKLIPESDHEKEIAMRFFTRKRSNKAWREWKKRQKDKIKLI